MSAAALPPDLAASVTPPVLPRKRRPWWVSVGCGCLGLVGLLGGLGAVSVLGVLASGILSGENGNTDLTPAWSPDGRQIAFASDRDGNLDVFVMQADGTQVKQLTHDPFAELYYLRSSYDAQPAWSPAGDQIVFVSGRENGMMTYVNTCLYRMQADGTQVEQLTVLGPHSFPTWSPDGQTFAFNDEFDLYVLDAGANQPEKLDFHLAEAERADWSPGGRRLAFDGWEKDAWNVYVVETDGDHLTQLTDGPGNSGQPQWSPDATQILFISDRDGNWDIYVMDADGGNVRQLTDDAADADAPVWSPDGRQIAFTSDRDGDWDIYVMDADGSNVVQLTGQND